MLEDKNLGEFWGNKWKNPLDWIGQRKEERKSLKSFWNYEEHVREKLFKRLIFRNSISRNWGLINRKIDSIDRAPIELGRTKPKILKHFQSVEKHTWSIENLEKMNFRKTEEVLCRKHSNQLISWIKCMSMSLKVFKKHLILTQIFQKQYFYTFCPKKSIN